MCSSIELENTKKSTKYTYTKERSCVIECKNLCSVCAAPHNPKGILKNSNRPNGVVMALLGEFSLYIISLISALDGVSLFPISALDGVSLFSISALGVDLIDID
uniref:Uncharacterized protein n=1 Tax=Cacopsylla melanoneura TaxID=428564 RepID=A0A8D9BYS6_9HEMI